MTPILINAFLLALAILVIVREIRRKPVYTKEIRRWEDIDWTIPVLQEPSRQRGASFDIVLYRRDPRIFFGQTAQRHIG